MGYEADDLLSIFDALSESDIWQYRYPEESKLEAVGVRGVYLGNYVRWDPLAQHLQMVKEASYHSSNVPRTFDVYDNIDDWHFMNLHDLIKQCKFGYGRVLDQSCREIRHHRISRNQAIGLVRRYTSQEPEYLNLFLEWAGISPSGLNYLISRHSKFTPNAHDESMAIEDLSNDLNYLFFPTSSLGCSIGPVSVTIGKGYP